MIHQSSTDSKMHSINQWRCSKNINTPMEFTVTDSAFDKLAELILEEQDEMILGLRIYIKGGGCSGFTYAFTFADQFNEDDHIIESTEGLKVAIDAMSAMYLEGGELDYIKSLEGEMFKISNPMAQTHCGCGSSFSI